MRLRSYRGKKLAVYTVGAGVDYAFTNNIFGRVEYRYTDFGSKTFDLAVARSTLI